MRNFFQIQHVGCEKNFISSVLDVPIQPLDEEMFLQFPTYDRWIAG